MSSPISGADNPSLSSISFANVASVAFTLLASTLPNEPVETAEPLN